MRNNIKPITPIVFLMTFICMLPSIRPDTWNKITPEAQQKDVRIAYKSPVFN